MTLTSWSTAEDEKVSLAGMKVTFDHGYGRSSSITRT